MSNPLFHGTIEKTRVGDWVQAISQFGDEAIVQINENGWRAKVSDASNVAFTDAMIDVNGFGVYDLDAESNEDGFVMGLNLERFGEVINMAASGTAIEFTCPTVHKMEIVAGGVSYTLQGINTDTIEALEEMFVVPPNHEHDGYGGQVDLIYRDPATGGVVVADLKTSSAVRDEHKYQAAAYAKAVEKTGMYEGVDRAEIIRIHPDSEETEVYEFSDFDQYWQEFAETTKNM